MTQKLNFRISGQKINTKNSVKYLGLVIDEWLKWKEHYDILRAKLERSPGLLAKLKYFVSQNLLRTVYFAIFDSYLRYGCQVWGQHNDSNNNKIAKLQDKAVRIVSFKDRNTPCEPLCKDRKIIRFFDLVSYYNCLFVAEHLNQNLPSSFGNYFTYMAHQHNHSTRGALKKLMNVPQSKTSFYGTHSITAKSVNDWNSLQNKIVFEFDQEIIDISKLTSSLKQYFFTSYVPVTN